MTEAETVVEYRGAVERTFGVRGSGLRRLALLLVLVPVASIVACGGGRDETTAPSSPERVAEGSGYKVTLPGGWKHDGETGSENAPNEPDVFMGEVIDGHPVTATVIRESVPSGVTLEDYVAPDERLDASRKQAERLGTTIGDIGPGQEVMLDGVRALGFDVPVGAGESRLRTRVVVTMRDNIAYIVSFGALSEHFDQQLPQFEAILVSWRWS